MEQLDLFQHQPIESKRTEITLSMAKEIVRDGRKDGIICPCCDQFAKIYNRKLNSGMALALILMYREYSRTAEQWVHVEELFRKKGFKCSHDWALLRFWGLIESYEPDSDSLPERKTNGKWSITYKGRIFVADKTTKVPERILLYANHFIKYEGEYINIEKALTNKFSYSELMDEKI
jgi:hypothetical protein